MRGPRSSRPKTAVAYGVSQLRRYCLQETQKEFAKRFSVTVGTVARWESTHPPTRDTLQRIYDLAREKNFQAAEVFRAELAGDHAAERLFQRVNEIETPANLHVARALLKRAWMAAFQLNPSDPQRETILECLRELAERITVDGRADFEDFRATVETMPGFAFHHAKQGVVVAKQLEASLVEHRKRAQEKKRGKTK